MRIVVPNTAGIGTLAEHLSAAFDIDRISLGGERREVAIQVDRESDLAILHGLDAVEHWLEQTGAGLAEVWIGKYPYRITRRPPAETWQ